MATPLIEPFARIVAALASRQPGAVINILRTFALLWSNLPAMLRTHRMLWWAGKGVAPS